VDYLRSDKVRMKNDPYGPQENKKKKIAPGNGSETRYRRVCF